MLLGRARDYLYGGLYYRDVYKNSCSWIHSSQRKLHEEPLELHGLLCCNIWVSNADVDHGEDDDVNPI